MNGLTGVTGFGFVKFFIWDIIQISKGNIDLVKQDLITTRRVAGAFFIIQGLLFMYIGCSILSALVKSYREFFNQYKIKIFFATLALSLPQIGLGVICAVDFFPKLKLTEEISPREEAEGTDRYI